MRKSVPRVTALVAIIATLAAACATIVPRTISAHGRERDRAIRTTRTGAQRLDAGDGAIHSHEETDSTHSSTAVGPTDASTAGCADQDSHPTLVEHARCSQGHDLRHTVVQTRPGRAPALAACLDAHAPDRAPPVA